MRESSGLWISVESSRDSEECQALPKSVQTSLGKHLGRLRDGIVPSVRNVPSLANSLSENHHSVYIVSHVVPSNLHSAAARNLNQVISTHNQIELQTMK